MVILGHFGSSDRNLGDISNPGDPKLTPDGLFLSEMDTGKKSAR